jgi:uncharacterized membrane protein YGL010W
MRNIEEHVITYASYHRDKRNIATHFVGVPLILLAVVMALSLVGTGLSLGGIAISGACIGIAAVSLYYLWLDVVLGIVCAVILLALWFLAQAIMVAQPQSALMIAISLFVVGWALQFWGHFFEGKKPAFVDDMMGLVISLPFLVAEIFFAVGLKPALKAAVEAKVGPAIIRQPAMKV